MQQHLLTLNIRIKRTLKENNWKKNKQAHLGEIIMASWNGNNKSKRIEIKFKKEKQQQENVNNKSVLKKRRNQNEFFSEVNDYYDNRE